MRLVPRTKPTVQILGTVEIVYGVCGITNVKPRTGPRDRFLFDYDGTGTQVNWDSQTTVAQNGQRLFVGDDGNHYTEDQLELVDELSDEGSHFGGLSS